MPQYQLPGGGYYNSSGTTRQVQLPDGSYINEVAAAGGVTAQPAQGTTVISGLAPVRLISEAIPQGTIVVSGLAPLGLVSEAIPKGTVVVSGLAPTAWVLTPIVVTPTQGTIVVSGLAPQLSFSTVVPVPQGTIVFAGAPPSFSVPVTLSVVVLQGRAPIIVKTSFAYAAFTDWIKRDG